MESQHIKQITHELLNQMLANRKKYDKMWHKLRVDRIACGFDPPPTENEVEKIVTYGVAIGELKRCFIKGEKKHELIPAVKLTNFYYDGFQMYDRSIT